MPLIRARHEVFGVQDVPDTDYYRDNGWTPVDPTTPTAADEQTRMENDIRTGAYDPAEHTVTDVVAVLENATPDAAAELVAAEKAGKARKSVLSTDTEGA